MMTFGGADIKPTNVQDNSIFVETDTARRYWFDVEKTPSSTQLFEGSANTDITSTNTTYVNSNSTTSDQLYFDPRRSASNYTGTWDLGSTLSETSWVMRFPVNIASLGTSGAACRVFFGLSSHPSSEGASSNNISFIGCCAANTGSILQWYRLSTKGNNLDVGETSNYALATGQIYIEIIRKTETTYSVRWTTNSDYSGGTIVNETVGSNGGSGSTSSMNLRYFWVGNINVSGNSDRPVQGNIPDVKIYNGITSVPATWTGKIMYDGSRGVFGGGSTSNTTIDYITIATLGNATDFGDLTVGRNYLSGMDNATRGVFAGGGSNTNVMDYITILTTGNATDFGDLTVGRTSGGGLNNSTRGVMGGGNSGSVTNVMDYITIATTGNATDFGDLTLARSSLAGLNSDTRGVFGGGADGLGAYNNNMDYITVDTTGNATDFGDLTVVTGGAGGISNLTRGLFTGGYTGTHNTKIDYITIATTGNATDFGDMTVAKTDNAGVQTSTRGVMGGGSTNKNNIDYVTIATLGNATDFGDLTVGRHALAGVSNYAP
jgi:hypothetical protein